MDKPKLLVYAGQVDVHSHTYPEDFISIKHRYSIARHRQLLSYAKAKISNEIESLLKTGFPPAGKPRALPRKLN